MADRQTPLWILGSILIFTVGGVLATIGARPVGLTILGWVGPPLGSLLVTAGLGSLTGLTVGAGQGAFLLTRLGATRAVLWTLLSAATWGVATALVVALESVMPTGGSFRGGQQIFHRVALGIAVGGGVGLVQGTILARKEGSAGSSIRRRWTLAVGVASLTAELAAPGIAALRVFDAWLANQAWQLVAYSALKSAVHGALVGSATWAVLRRETGTSW